MKPENKIYSLNVDKCRKSFIAYLDYIIMNQALVALAQDIPSLELDPGVGEAITRASIEYQVYTKGPDEGPSDNLILVHKSIKSQHRIVPDTKDRKRMARKNYKSSVLAIAAQLEPIQRLDSVEAKLTTIFSVYIRPGADYKCTNETLTWIQQITKSFRIIIMGDFNASSLLWMPGQLNPEHRNPFIKEHRNLKYNRGRAIERFIHFNRLYCLNRIELGPTFRRVCTDGKVQESFIDLALVGRTVNRTWNQCQLEQITGGTLHKMLIIRHHEPRIVREVIFKLKQVRENEFIQFKETFKQKINAESSTIEQWPREKIITCMNELVDELYLVMLKAQERVKLERVKRSTIKNNGLCHTTHLMATKYKQVRKKFYRAKFRADRFKNSREHDKDDSHIEEIKLNVIKYRRILRVLKRKIMRKVDKSTYKDHISHEQLINNESDSDNDSSTDGDSDVDEDGDGDEDMNMSIDNDNLDQRDSSSECDSDEDVEFSTQEVEIEERKPFSRIEYLEEFAKKKFPPSAASTAHGPIRAELDDCEKIILTDEEIDRALKRLRRRKDDRDCIDYGLKYCTFNRSALFLIDEIRTICKMSFASGKLPNSCRTNLGRLREKRSRLDWRIIQEPANPLTELLEFIAQKRLASIMEQQNLYSPYQFAYIAGRDRHDLMTRIIELKDRYEFKLGKRIWGYEFTLVKLDIQSAFDSCDHGVMTSKLMQHFGKNSFGQWLVSNLRERQIKLYYNGKLTNARQLHTGIPQGSRLSPTLWNLYLNELPDEHLVIEKELELLIYADDLFILYLGKEKKILQQFLNNLSNKLGKLNLNLSHEKCQYIKGVLNRCPVSTNLNHKFVRLPNEFTINGLEIQRVKEMSILGVKVYYLGRLRLRPGVFSITEMIGVKLRRNIRRLYQLRCLNIIHTASDWHQLINTHIVHTTLNRLYPFLAVTPSALKICDQLIKTSIEQIFSWSQSTALDHTLLFTKTFITKVYVARWLEMKRARRGTNGPNSYDTLLRIFLVIPYTEEATKLSWIREKEKSDITRELKAISERYRTGKFGQMEFKACNKLITRALCSDYQVWQKISPSSLSCMDLMLLKGLRRLESSSKLTSGKLEPDELPAGCKEEECSDIHNRRHNLLHYMFDCPRFSEEREAFESSVDDRSIDDADDREEILLDYKLRKELFKFMAACIKVREPEFQLALEYPVELVEEPLALEYNVQDDSAQVQQLALE